MNQELVAWEAVSETARDLEAQGVTPTILTDVLIAAAIVRLGAETGDIHRVFGIAEILGTLRAD